MAWKLQVTAELPAQAAQKATENRGGRRPGSPIATALLLLAAAAVLINGRKGPAVDSLPGSLEFGSQPVQSITPEQTIKFRNSGTSDLHLSNAVVAGSESSDFQVGLVTCMGGATAPGQTCEVGLRFHPLGAGPRQAKLILVDDAGNSPQSIDLSGTGIARADLRVAPAVLAFAEELKGGMSDWQSVALQNAGGEPVQVSAIELQDDTESFALDRGECLNASLAAGQSCDVKVRFSPPEAKSYTAHLVVSDSTGDAPHDIVLSGNGRETSVASARVSPSSLNFGRQQLDKAAVQSIGVVSVGNIPLRTGDIQISGEGASEFAAENDCAHRELPAGRECRIQVRFTPRAQGRHEAQLALRSEAGENLQLVTLLGFGEPPPKLTTPTPTPVTRVVAHPDQYSFPQQEALTASSPQTVTITSVGNAPARVQRYYVQGAAPGDFVVRDVNCAGRTLAPNQECNVSVLFSPKGSSDSASTQRSAELVVEVADGAPARIALRGSSRAPAPASAVEFSVSPAEIDFGNTQTGQQSQPRTITLSNPGSAPKRVKAVLPNESAGDFRVVEANCRNSLIPANGSCTIAMAFTPQRAGEVQSKLTLASAAPVQVETVRLTGRAMPEPAPPANFFVKPQEIAFGGSPLGEQSAPRTVSLINPGGASISIHAALQGANQGDFRVIAANCRNQSIPAHGNCEVTLAFLPRDVGSRTSSLALASDSQLLSVYLSGTGLPRMAQERLVVRPTEVDFGELPIGRSNQRQVTVYNPGNAPVGIRSVLSSSEFQVVGTNCQNATVPAGGNCAIAIAFSPRQVGGRRSQMVLASNSQQQTVYLSGSGMRKSEPPAPQTGWCCIKPSATAIYSRSSSYNVVQATQNDCTQHGGKFFTDNGSAKAACQPPPPITRPAPTRRTPPPSDSGPVVN